MCTECDGLVTLLTTSRAEGYPFSKTWPGALSAMLRPGAMLYLFIVSCAAETLLAERRGLWTLAWLLQFAWVLFLVRRVTAHCPPFGLPTYGDFGAVLTWLLPRAAPSAVPLFFGAAFLVDFGQQSASPGDVRLWLLVICGVFWGVHALLVSGVEGVDAGFAVPWTAARKAREFGSDAWVIYLAMAGFVFFTAINACQPPFSMEDLDLGWHIIVAWGFRAAATTSLAATALLAAHFIFTHDLQNRVPRVAEAPQGMRKPPPQVDEELVRQQREARFKPIELDES